MIGTLDSLQISEAFPLDDGSLQTTLRDQSGAVVATVTRLTDGSAQATVDDNGGFNWESILGKVTGFLDHVADMAKQGSTEATRISNAAKGALTGAKVGYEAPTNVVPYVVAGAAVLAMIIVGFSGGNRNPPRRSHRRRRR